MPSNNYTNSMVWCIPILRFESNSSIPFERIDLNQFASGKNWLFYCPPHSVVSSGPVVRPMTMKWTIHYSTTDIVD